ncbi:hypothetical protein KIV56_16480 [Cryobacterium breve]|uniref:NADH:ubiquinone oxidoreductase-like 20kDa subunit domain-containing protein n=1 Tax=Cryobacterium breve TaxID=1259258 RepID=A0ABY7NIJ1_9MICO|nr:hypothetical protein KIV56_16480 [Cryobacterium breve]
MRVGDPEHDRTAPAHSRRDPHPRFIIAVGDCAITGGVFADGYGVAGSVSDFVHVDLAVPGTPPEPAAIVDALRRMTGR